VQKEIIKTSFPNILLLVLAGIGLHVFYLVVNYGWAKAARLGECDLKAILFMSSQKTLPISIAIISFLPAKEFGSKGLLTIPCIIAHVSQLFIDAAIAARMATSYEKRLAAEKSAGGAEVGGDIESGFVEKGRAVEAADGCAAANDDVIYTARMPVTKVRRSRKSIAMLLRGCL
jgi:solute carrier family 10 (sodium/bile acid cotransporter), member 7